MNGFGKGIAIIGFGAALLVLPVSTSFARGQREVSTSDSVTAKATIVAIDKATRTVTLRNAQGIESKVIAGNQVQRFDQLKVGDVISATYSQAMAVKIRKPGAAAPLDKAETIVRDQHGANVTKERTISVDVVEIDIPNEKVTVKDAKGAKSSYKVRDMKNLREFKVGDKVDVTYTEGLLITADPAQ